MSTNQRVFQLVLRVLVRRSDVLTVVSRRAMATAAASSDWSAAAGRKVFVTRRVPGDGVEMLRSAGCVVTQWNRDDMITRDELARGVQGCDALFCLLTDRIDKHILDAAGAFSSRSRLT